jgi:hypothetical protein
VTKRVFRYRPACNAPRCGEPAVYKVAAAWSDGTSRELKNYGLACAAHGASQLARASRNHAGLRLADGETVGPVELYLLRDDCRDIDLARVVDPPSA